MPHRRFRESRSPFSRDPKGSAFADHEQHTAESTVLPHPVIDILPEQKQIEGLGGNMRLGGRDVAITPGTFAAKLFSNAREVRMRFRHRYEVDPKYIPTLEENGMIFSGRAPVYPIMQVLELPTDVHPFFIATQAHPELLSRPIRPEPLFKGLVTAALDFAAEHRAATPASSESTLRRTTTST